MRIRTIKPDFWRSDDIAALSIEDRLLFIGLWSYVDDNGVGRDEPQLIQCDLFPLDPLNEGSLRVHGGLTRLSERGLITRYAGPDGRRYLQINSWDRHQRINRPSRPRFPRYDTETCTLSEGSLSPHDSLDEGSSPEQGTGNRELGNRETPHTPRGGEGDDATNLAVASAARGGPRTRTEREPEGFAEFYDIYPRHVARRTAAKAYAKALSRATPETILAGARRLAADPNLPESRYIRYPATWLNADGWRDDPMPPRNDHRRDGGQAYFDLAARLAQEGT
ncbi:hypothetical protein [Actinomyces gaoshouyii]|uniref:hypothetical protein n=1 Tax=Actinomyces gaoshouyii TaxID=1960083 RepID=UPI0009BD600E|nr:hypothetical protein [Actinomyces gaoshouyii]ARD42491.1 hypothetical protein B6G06_09185 [Actinomyces gaoshouyii]